MREKKKKTHTRTRKPVWQFYDVSGIDYLLKLVVGHAHAQFFPSTAGPLTPFIRSVTVALSSGNYAENEKKPLRVTLSTTTTSRTELLPKPSHPTSFQQHGSCKPVSVFLSSRGHVKE